ncbi:hypothetical protein [Spongiimicrobium sp. 3-5]|uniref:hypothetical protein n=1 Tax=Spongiimicrobium sp. 3-5 TaxID=3332596 RepID=UPI003980289D
MTSSVDLLSQIPDVIETANFEHYISSIGYTHKPDLDIGVFRCYLLKQDENLRDVIFLAKLEGEERYYSLVKKDQGNILNFIKRRIEDGDKLISFNPSKDNLIEASNTLVNFLKDGNPPFKSSLESYGSGDLDDLLKNAFSRFYKLYPIVDFEVMGHYGIVPETTQNMVFHNCAFNAKPTLNSVLEEHGVPNVAFPVVDEKGNQIGIHFLDNTDDAGFNADFTDLSGLWLTNATKLSYHEKTHFTMVSKPIEAYAHYQFFQKNNESMDNRRYFCPLSLNENAMHRISKLLESENSILHLACNVSHTDFLREIRLLIYLMAQKDYGIQLNYTNETELALRIGLKDDHAKLYAQFLKRILKFNRARVEELTMKLGREANNFVKTDIIKINENRAKGLIKILVPLNHKTLNAFIGMLTKSFPIGYTVHLEKPRFLKWSKQQQAETWQTENEDNTIDKESAFITIIK